MCFDEYWRLVKQGQATHEEIQSAWSSIISEYCDSIRTLKTQTMFESYQRIIYTDWKIEFVAEACHFLKMLYEPWIAERLVTLGFDFVENLEDKDDYLKQIYMVESEAKTLIVLLNQYHAEYRLLCPDGEGVEKRSLMDYKKELMVLSKFMGYRIVEHEITVLDFCSIANIYIDANKQKPTGDGTTV